LYDLRPYRFAFTIYVYDKSDERRIPRNTGPADPLIPYLRRGIPDITEPVFHVSRMSRHGLQVHRGKDGNPSSENSLILPKQPPRKGTEGRRIRQFKGHTRFGFDAPRTCVRPISHERKIGLALIEEFIEGLDLDYYFKQPFTREKARTWSQGWQSWHHSSSPSPNDRVYKLRDLWPRRSTSRKFSTPLRRKYRHGPGPQQVPRHARHLARGSYYEIDKGRIVHGDPTPPFYIYARWRYRRHRPRAHERSDPVSTWHGVCRDQTCPLENGEFYASEPI